MKNIALIFPGQGAQKVGMGLEFYQSSPEAKAIFDQADEIFSQCHCEEPEGRRATASVGQYDRSNISQVIFEGPEEKLTSTAYCQPAILTMSMAALKAFEAHPKYKEFSIKFTAGHSLGEYAALAAGGVMSFSDTLRLVQKRAACMETAAKENPGSMAAVIGFDVIKLVEICRETGAQIANFNSNEQIVITGSQEKVAAAIEAIKAAGGQKVIPLAVSGAFHSSLMSSAASKFAEALKDVKFNPAIVPVLSNVTGLPHYFTTVIPAKAGIQDIEQIRQNLARQITDSVQWVKCVEYIASQGITHFIEIGPGKVLKGLIRRINPALTVSNIEKPQDIEALILP